MKTTQVCAPPLCCSIGVLGTGTDPDLVHFLVMFSQLNTHGIKVERYNLYQQPLAFAQNFSVKALLDKEGTEALPLIFLGGENHLKGRYPTRERVFSLVVCDTAPGTALSGMLRRKEAKA